MKMNLSERGLESMFYIVLTCGIMVTALNILCMMDIITMLYIRVFAAAFTIANTFCVGVFCYLCTRGDD